MAKDILVKNKHAIQSTQPYRRSDMETLIKSIGLTLALFISVMSYGQNEIIQKAFSESYVSENEKNYVAALVPLKKVYDEKSYELNLRIGYLLFLNENYSESKLYYTKACNLESKSIEARLGLANAIFSNAEYSLLKAVYEEILRIDPNHSVTNYRLGLIYYYAKDYATALTFFKKINAMYPFDYDSLLMMGWTNYFLGKTTDAKLYFNKVLLYNPGDTSATEGLDLIK
ncbi:MAG TPA: hypothetical protein DHV29_06650 [Bacteroidales bacterium]|nr:hypothetical protein [Bacteroidales bacterium]HCB62010.1 hypothetical protein [Bacteroidales bacterium]HCY23154.1 hypothetical protein [Bacteroidales bacterium]